MMYLQVHIQTEHLEHHNHYQCLQQLMVLLQVKKAIAELIIYDDVLSAGDITTVERYLQDKWGHY